MAILYFPIVKMQASNTANTANTNVAGTTGVPKGNTGVKYICGGSYLYKNSCSMMWYDCTNVLVEKFFFKESLGENNICITHIFMVTIMDA